MNERMDKLISQTTELLGKDTSQMKLWDLIEELADELSRKEDSYGIFNR